MYHLIKNINSIPIQKIEKLFNLIQNSWKTIYTDPKQQLDDAVAAAAAQAAAAGGGGGAVAPLPAGDVFNRINLTAAFSPAPGTAPTLLYWRRLHSLWQRLQDHWTAHYLKTGLDSLLKLPGTNHVTCTAPFF